MKAKSEKRAGVKALEEQSEAYRDVLRLMRAAALQHVPAFREESQEQRPIGFIWPSKCTPP